MMTTHLKKTRTCLNCSGKNSIYSLQCENCGKRIISLRMFLLYFVAIYIAVYLPILFLSNIVSMLKILAVVLAKAINVYPVFLLIFTIYFVMCVSIILLSLYIGINLFRVRPVSHKLLMYFLAFQLIYYLYRDSSIWFAVYVYAGHTVTVSVVIEELINNSRFLYFELIQVIVLIWYFSRSKFFEYNFASKESEEQTDYHKGN